MFVSDGRFVPQSSIYAIRIFVREVLPTYPHFTQCPSTLVSQEPSQTTLKVAENKDGMRMVTKTKKGTSFFITYSKLVEPRGIEPLFAECHSADLPLIDGPSFTDMTSKAGNNPECMDSRLPLSNRCRNMTTEAFSYTAYNASSFPSFSSSCKLVRMTGLEPVVITSV